MALTTFWWRRPSAGKVEGTDDIAGYAALREPYQEWGPMLGNGAAADVVQFIKDVGASVQDAGKDQLLRHGLVVLKRTYSPPGMWGFGLYLM